MKLIGNFIFGKLMKKRHFFFQMFLDETLESIPYGKLALCYSVIACPYKSFGDFYEWMYRMRNLIINQDIHNGNIDSVMDQLIRCLIIYLEIWL